MNRQLSNRLAPPDIRDTLEQFVAGRVAAPAAAAALGISRSRLYQIKTDYLRARAEGRLSSWAPGRSGGDHRPGWPALRQRSVRRMREWKAARGGAEPNPSALKALRHSRFSDLKMLVRPLPGES